MKRVLCTTLVLLFTLLLTACGSNESNQEKYEVIELKDIVITQISKEHYEIGFSITYEISNEKVYFSKNDKLSNADTEVETIKEGLNYSFEASAEIDDYIIYIVYDDKTVKHGITIPNMSPTITTIGDSKKYVEIDYGFNSSSSWSAFCDPTGKNIYRSSKTIFDVTANLIIENENIVVVKSNDINPNEDEQFYFIVLKSKNGNVTFISNALTSSENIVESISLDLKDVNGTATLQAKLELNPIISDTYELKVKSGTESFQIEGIESNGVYTYNFDLTQLSQYGVWYDIVLSNVNTGVDLAIMDSSANMSSSVTTKDTKYTFKEWENFLKVNAETFIADDVNFSKIEFSSEDDTPTLTFVATSSNDFTIEINSQEIIPTKSGNIYTFTCDLSGLTEANKWYDINYKIDGVTKTIDASLADFNNKITVNGKVYEFKEWSNQLKVQFSDEVKLLVNFTAVTITDEDGVPTLTLVATSNESINIVIRYTEDDVKKDLATLTPTKDGDVYTFTFDLSNMIVAGDWHDLVYTNGDVELNVPEGNTDDTQTVTIDNKTYRFEKYEGQKIAFSTND